MSYAMYACHLCISYVKKMDRFGFKGQVNDYLRSYLTDRQINVVLDGQESVSALWLFKPKLLVEKYLIIIYKRKGTHFC